MASLDSLPPDQRAVLQMVLERGRSYDHIAKMLSIDRERVRDRAAAALDALGPGTSVPVGRRSLITDYLLGQLPADEERPVRERLAKTPGEWAWARVVASELTPLATSPMHQIPMAGGRRSIEPVDEPSAAEPWSSSTELAVAEEPASPWPAADEVRPGEAVAPARRRVSRLGGAILLGSGAVIAAAVVFFVLSSSSSKHHSSVPKGAVSPASQAAPSSNAAASSTTAAPVAEINLLSPDGSKSTAGIAEVLRQGNTRAVAIVGQGLPANTKYDAYAVWLYHSSRDAIRLGFVNPGVGRNGRLETTGPLPADVSRYKQLLITIETTANPRRPGHVVLQGSLTGV